MKAIRIVFFLLGCILLNQFIIAQDTYELLYIKGNYDEILQTSHKLNTENDYYWRAFILDKKGETLNSIKILNEGIIKFNDKQMLGKLLADYLYKTGQYSTAKPLLLKYADNDGSFIKLIKVLEFDGESSIAIEQLQNKIITDSLNTEYLTLLGNLYYQTDSIDATISIFEKIRSLNPRDQLTTDRLAKLY